METKGSFENVLDNLFICPPSEWRLARHHDEHHYTHRPVVALGGVGPFEYFRRDVVGGAVRGIHNFRLRNAFGKAKINKLDVGVIILFEQQKVLRLDVTVADFVVVQVA